MSNRSISEEFMSRMTKDYQGLEFTNLFTHSFCLAKICLNTVSEIIFSFHWNISCSIVSCFSFFIRHISSSFPSHDPAAMPVNLVLLDSKEFLIYHKGFTALPLTVWDYFAVPDTRKRVGLIKYLFITVIVEC